MYALGGNSGNHMGDGEVKVNRTTLIAWAVPTICLLLAIILIIVCERYYRSLRRRTMNEVLEEIRLSARFNPCELEPIESLYPISAEEEMRIYRRNRDWFKDAHAQGVNVWYNETFGGDAVCEIKIMKSVRTFMATYCKILGVDTTCSGCSVNLLNKPEWYRCRYCTDVNLCIQCFTRGYRDATSGHSSSHEVTKLSLDSRCEECHGYILDTKLVCENCEAVCFCFGCFRSGNHEASHADHSFKTIEASSFMMLPPQRPAASDTAGEPTSTDVHSSLPIYSVTSGVNVTSPTENMTSRVIASAAHPSEPPPSYHECVLTQI